MSHVTALCYNTENLAVGAVNRGILEGLEVDVCGALGGMPHGFADVGQGDILTLGDAGPGVACHVGGELGGKS